MNNSLRLFVLCNVTLFLGGPLKADLFSGNIKIDMSKEVAEALDKLGQNLGQAIKESAPAVGDEFRKSVPVVGEEIRKSMPHLDENVGHAAKAITKAANAIATMRAWPIIGIGLAGAITSVVMFARGIEKYIDADEDKERHKAKLHILASLIGLTVSGCVMGNSQNIVDLFCE